MNPFTERGRITNPARFTGRWREVGMVFEGLERRRPVMVAGGPGAGRSSLITHVAQSAAAVLEIPELAAFYFDLAAFGAPSEIYRLVARDLRGRGDSPEAMAEAIARSGRTTLICLDSAETAIAAGWGEGLLERMARLARASTPTYAGGLAPPGEGFYDLLLVAAARGAPPALSEPFTTVVIGAVAPAEVRLLAEAYLDGTGVEFTPGELRAIQALSAGHPAYLQRAAYHLFESRSRPGYDWRAAYLDEARERPVPGAPLPPEAFRGEGDAARDEAVYGEGAAPARPEAPPELRIEGPGKILAALLPLLIALFALQLSGSWLIAAAFLAAGYILAALALRGAGG